MRHAVRSSSERRVLAAALLSTVLAIAPPTARCEAGRSGFVEPAGWSSPPVVEPNRSDCRRGDEGTPARGVLRLRHDNDFFGDQDQGYTSGLMLDWTSAFGAGDGCLPTLVRTLRRRVEPASGSGGTRAWALYGGQQIYTPANGFRTELTRGDRPYAAVLFVGVGELLQRGADLIRNDLQLGLVGPSAQGEVSQRWAHRLIDGNRFDGWRNQLHDEPVVGLAHNRFRRWSVGESAAVGSPGSAAEVIGNWGGRIGNLFTWANAGVEFRAGRRLPDDFGSSPVRPGAPEARSGATATGSGTNLIGFVAAGVRLVLRDLTLDGNTFRSSHRVDGRRAVADLGYGFALSHGEWQLTFGRFHLTREFAQQRDRPIYGTVSVSRRF